MSQLDLVINTDRAFVGTQIGEPAALGDAHINVGA